jgi:hypothetical protein
MTPPQAGVHLSEHFTPNRWRQVQDPRRSYKHDKNHPQYMRASMGCIMMLCVHVGREKVLKASVYDTASTHLVNRKQGETRTEQNDFRVVQSTIVQ